MMLMLKHLFSKMLYINGLMIMTILPLFKNGLAMYSNSFKANAFLIVYSKGGEGKSTLFGLLEQLVGAANTTAIPLSNKDFGLEPLLNKNLISQLNHRRANSAPTN